MDRTAVSQADVLDLVRRRFGHADLLLVDVLKAAGVLSGNKTLDLELVRDQHLLLKSVAPR